MKFHHHFGSKKKIQKSMKNHQNRSISIKFGRKRNFWSGKEIHFSAPFCSKSSQKEAKISLFCLILSQNQAFSAHFDRFSSKSIEIGRNLGEAEPLASSVLGFASPRRASLAILARKAPIVALLARARVLKHRALGLAGLRCASPRGLTWFRALLARARERCSASLTQVKPKTG